MLQLVDSTTYIVRNYWIVEVYFLILRNIIWQFNLFDCKYRGLK